jgi:CheY-like chemotaxis protein/anti-sigma regulatory factor (Ser/Thr protein kinase)
MARKKSVLLVDDDPDIHELLRKALRHQPLNIESSYDGADALARLQARPYNLVLTDLLMPGMDGLTLIGRIRELRPETKIVVMTAANTPGNLIASIREKAFSYFGKPFSAAAVADAVLRALDSSASIDEIDVTSARPEWIALKVPCRMETADRLTQFFREMRTGLGPEQQESIVTAFRELLFNAIEHGGRSDPEKKVELTYIRTSRAIIYYIRDPGEGFSLEHLPHAAISNRDDRPLEHAEIRENLGIRPGGFGILLTRKLVDDLIYSEKGNEVLLIKYIDPA